MSSIKGYKDPKARQVYINKWTKEHYDSIKGFRPFGTIEVITEDGGLFVLRPEHFVYAGSIKQPFKLWGHNFRVHVPRSLLKRARIYVDKVTHEIKGTSAMHTANK